MKKPARILAATLVALSLLPALPGAVAAQEVRTYSKKASYDDVRFELTNAVISRGLTIDYAGNIGSMLARTGADVGSDKPLYKSAELFTFCSARLSRKLMEADPMNIGFCPYVVFIYESVGQPGLVVAGYRRPPEAGTPQTRAALAEIDKLLDGIVKQAVE